MIGDRTAIRRRFRRAAGLTAEKPSTPDSQWFWDHYEVAAGEIVNFCETSGLRLTDLEVADVGCGDGIMSLGFCRRVQLRKVVGFDIVPTNVETLKARCRSEGVPDTLPAELEFRGSTAATIPAADGEFDFVYSWSAFEHIADPVAVLNEIRRTLRPAGHFFLQLWPFYHSPKGSHLWPWFEEDFHHLLEDEVETLAKLRTSTRHPPDWTNYMGEQFQQLNRITVNGLQDAMSKAGFDVRRLELITAPITVPPGLGRYSWADLAIGGIKLLAVPGA